MRKIRIKTYENRNSNFALTLFDDASQCYILYTTTLVDLKMKMPIKIQL